MLNYFNIKRSSASSLRIKIFSTTTIIAFMLYHAATAQQATKGAVNEETDSKTWPVTEKPRNVDMEYFNVPEGLEVTRWASSPLLFNPTNIDIDHKGRIWVAEGVNYRRKNGRRPGGDRIAILEDTDGDGVADKSSTFVQEKELVAPLGVAVFDNVVVVSQPPNIIVYTDVNRNLKFEPEIDKREILLSGFNAGNHDHSLHSVTAGPDGKWYFNNGNCGALFTDKSDKTFRMGGSYYNSGGGDWFLNPNDFAGKKSDDGFVWTSGFSVRMNPDGTDAEIIGHGYRNSFENANTSKGDLFQNDNDDTRACRVSYVLEYGSAGFFSRDGKRSWREEARPGQSKVVAHWRQEDPGTFDTGDVYGGGSPTGIVFYENGVLGDKWEGLLLSAEAGRNTIFGYQPVRKGATWQLDRQIFCTTNVEQEFKGTDFSWWTQSKERNEKWKGVETPTQFRPSDVAIGADGCIYISDWFDGRVGGHGTFDDSCSGAIYRIAPKGYKPSIPAVDFNTTEGRIAALKSPAVNVRYSGFKGLVDGGTSSLNAVEKLLNHPNQWIASRAIWLLPHLGQNGVNKCVELLDDKNPEVRLTAYRALQRADVDILPYSLKMAKDESAAIRRDAALSMRGLAPEKTTPTLLAVAQGYDGKDKNYLESIGLGAENHENTIWLGLKKAHQANDPIEWSEEFSRLTWRLWPSAAVSGLQTRALSSQLTVDQRLFAIESIAFIDDFKASEAMLKIADSKLPQEIKEKVDFWLLKRGLGLWLSHGLLDDLKSRNIYDPSKIKVMSLVVPKPAKDASFTVADVLKLKGDPEAGKSKIMRCVMCHKTDEAGVDYGPSLKGWGQTQTLEVAANSIINPSADIAHNYTGYNIQLNNGNEVHGLLITDADPLVVKSAGDFTQMIPKKQVSAVKKLNRSLMLSADQLGLTPQDVADIISYLKQWK